MKTTETLGSRLLAHRARLGVNQVDVAVAVESQKSTVSMWERDLRAPSLEQLRALARYFGTTRAELLKGLDGPPHARRLPHRAA